MNRDGRPAIPPARGLSAGLELFNKTLQITHIGLDEGNPQMSKAKKAHCPLPAAVATACGDPWATTQPQALAKAGAALISEGIKLLSEARQDAPKLSEACRTKYPCMGAAMSTHIPASVREQARYLKRERAFASFQELYLEAILGSLIQRGVC